MNERKEAIFIVPENFTVTSASAIKLCELFAAKLIDSTEPLIEIKVDEKSRLVTSTNHSIKELVSMYLKSGQLDMFYEQLTALARKDVASNILCLNLVVHDRMHFISISELNARPKLHLRLRKVEVAISEKD